MWVFPKEGRKGGKAWTAELFKHQYISGTFAHVQVEHASEWVGGGGGLSTIANLDVKGISKQVM